MTSPVSNSIDKMSVYIAAGLISGGGVLMLNVLPVFVGALAETFGFSESQLGDIIAGYNVAFTVIAVSALVWIRRINWKVVSTIGVAITTVALILMTFASGFSALLIFVAIVGLGSGALYALIMAVLGDSNDPDKAYGLKLGLETLPGAGLLFVLPAIIAPKYGFNGVVITMAVVMVLLGLSTIYLPSKGIKGDVVIEENSSKQKQNYLLSYLSLFASLAYVAGLVATWAFLELLGTSNDISVNTVGTVLSLGFLIFGGGGGFVAAMIADRWGRVFPFVIIIAVNLFGLWQLSNFTDVTGYAIGSCLFMFSLNFALAYTFGLTAEVDNTGKLVVLSAAVVSLGAIVGPFVSGRLIESSGYNGMLMFSGACSLVTLASYLLVVYLHNKQN